MRRSEWTAWACWTALFAAVVGVAAAARAAEPLAATTMGVSAIAREDAAVLAECLDASAEQARAIDEVTDGAMARLRIIRADMQRQQRWMHRSKDRAAIDAEATKATKAMEEAERAWLSDVRALVSPGQEDGWRRFELARRRVMATHGVQASPQDLSAVIAAVGADEDSNPELKALVQRWEQEAGVIADRWVAEFAGVDLRALDPEAAKQKERLRLELRIGLTKAMIRAHRAATDAIEPSKRRAMLYIAANRIWRGSIPILEREPVMREFFQIDLSPERREEFLEFARERQQRVDEVLEARVKRNEDAFLASENGTYDMKEVEAAWEALQAVRREFERDVLGKLTENERREYERVAVAERERPEESPWRMGDVRELPGVGS